MFKKHPTGTFIVMPLKVHLKEVTGLVAKPLRVELISLDELEGFSPAEGSGIAVDALAGAVEKIAANIKVIPEIVEIMNFFIIPPCYLIN